MSQPEHLQQHSLFLSRAPSLHIVISEVHHSDCRQMLSQAGTGDERTAQDAYSFITGFLQRFPKYKGRSLWLSGESYGVPVPSLN